MSIIQILRASSVLLAYLHSSVNRNKQERDFEIHPEPVPTISLDRNGVKQTQRTPQLLAELLSGPCCLFFFCLRAANRIVEIPSADSVALFFLAG